MDYRIDVGKADWRPAPEGTAPLGRLAHASKHTSRTGGARKRSHSEKVGYRPDELNERALMFLIKEEAL